MGGIAVWPWIRHHQRADADARWYGGAQILPSLLSSGRVEVWGAILAQRPPDTSTPSVPDP